MLILAFLIGALGPIPALQVLLDKVGALALRANFANRLAPRYEVALRVFVTAEESFPTLRLAFNNVPLVAGGTNHADRILFDELTSGVI